MMVLKMAISAETLLSSRQVYGPVKNLKEIIQGILYWTDIAVSLKIVPV